MGSHTRKKSNTNFDIGSQVDKWNNNWSDSYDEMMENQDVMPTSDEEMNDYDDEDEDDW